MTKLMFDNLDRVGAAHSAGKGIKLDEAAKDLPLPLHLGAERFYREAGMLNPDPAVDCVGLKATH